MSSRGFPVTSQMRDSRRNHAENALAEYNKLTTEQKLERLPKDGAKKQRARLEALLESEKNPKPEAPAKGHKWEDIKAKKFSAEKLAEIEASVADDVDRETSFRKKGKK